MRQSRQKRILPFCTETTGIGNFLQLSELTKVDLSLKQKPTNDVSRIEIGQKMRDSILFLQKSSSIRSQLLLLRFKVLLQTNNDKSQFVFYKPNLSLCLDEEEAFPS